MNIEKLARHLKEFTLEEIEMIAECDVKSEIERLLKEGKIIFEQGLYKYVEADESLKFGVFIDNSKKKVAASVEDAVQNFLNNYAAKFCSPKTNRLYKSAFKLDLLPVIKKNNISKFETQDIITIYNSFTERDFKPKRLKNTMALLKQFLKYCKAEGLIKNYTNFYVKRLTEKNEYSLDRIIFEV